MGGAAADVVPVLCCAAGRRALPGLQCIEREAAHADGSQPIDRLDDLSCVFGRKPAAAGWSAVELVDHLQIVVSDPSPMSEGLDFGVLSPGTWRVSDLATKLALTQGGVGWGNLPLWMVDADLACGALVRVTATALGEQSETALTAYLLWRIDQPPGPAARHLRERLLARFGEGG